MLERDSNTGYFHRCANGSKSKMKITMLQGDDVITDSQKHIEHVTEYYKDLFGKADTVDIHLEHNMWPVDQQVQQEDNEWLTRPFSMEVILDVALKEIRGNTAPGLGGFSIEFFKTQA